MSQPDGWPTTRVSLLARIRNTDDGNAWRAFVDLYAPVVYAYCRRRCLQRADAENIAQEVFTRVSRSIGRFEYDAERGRFRGWLGLITHQQLLRYQERQARSRKKVVDPPPHELHDSFAGEAEATWVDVFNAHVFSCAMRNLRAEFGSDEFCAFERVWNDREPPGDVARSMQKEPQWIYQVKYKIVCRLKDEIARLTADIAALQRP
jgi:RNA polymerase sigma-70 factor (ECF subfamily)